ncbi:MAG: ribosomal RNA small subunit methyltransferase A, partial [Ignavibacteriaceae bacterium]
HIYFKELSESKEEQRLFIKIVKAAFGNRRKTLKNSFENSLSSVGLENIDFESAGINLSLRAEQLTADDFKKLTKYVFKLQNLK